MPSFSVHMKKHWRVCDLQGRRSATRRTWGYEEITLQGAARRAAPAIPLYCSTGVFVLGWLAVEGRPLLIV